MTSGRRVSRTPKWGKSYSLSIKPGNRETFMMCAALAEANGLALSDWLFALMDEKLNQVIQ